jgi:DnaJ-class molecular chaperone
MNMGMPNMDEIFQQFFGMNMGGLGGMRMHRMDGQGIPGIHIIHNGIPINLGGGIPNMFQQNFVFEKPTPIIKTVEVSMEQVLTGATVPVEIERWIVQNQTKVFEKEQLYVTVPQGVDDNELILLRDKGNVPNENCKGDVKIFISVKNNTCFQRKGLDLIMEKTLTLKEGLCGFHFEFTYINGKTFTINNTGNAIIKPNQEKTVNGLGLTRDGHTGNLTIHFNIDFPDSLPLDKVEKLKEIL